jgi:meso-butanediol dehydrogenase/(S,S)-butanediol dehydrogenase/diacetyl reductase
MAGKVALITGAAGGIGSATGELFCEQGARVMLVDRDADALDQAAAAIMSRVPGAAVRVCVADVSRPDHAADAVERAVAAFGSLDVLVNNAGIRYIDPIAEADLDKWQAVLSVNLLGALNFSKAATKELRKRGGASVVNVSSAYAVIGRKGFGAYDASKAALLAFTRTLAWEEAEHGVRVNAVCPGSTITPFSIKRGAARGLTETEMRSEVKTDSLLRRWADPKEIAYPILWLASDEASFVTGAALMADGGLSII